MDGQVQSKYARKNWSSFMIFNCHHEANQALTPEMVNALPVATCIGFAGSMIAR